MSRIHTSEPRHHELLPRPPLSQWQRDRAAGPIHPMHKPGTWTDAIMSGLCVAFTGGALVVAAAFLGG